jgi:serine/threonine protein kinase
MIGRILAHYEVVGSLGKGGMGEVYVAEDTKLQRRVALKVLPKEMAADPERRSRFEREARAVAALSHPNIVTVYSVEEADGVHFITMELVEGKTLAKVLPRNGFSLGELLEIAIPLADAVSSAHRTGITHRDLKPDNIMVDGEGRLRVLDFGLAKLHDSAGAEEGLTHAPTATVETEEGKILGTVAYMSPEQAEGKTVDPRSDVFSLGTILHEMATGERPFRGDTKMSTIGAILKDQPASVTERNPSPPPGPHRAPMSGQRSRPPLPDGTRSSKRARAPQGRDRLGRARRRARPGRRFGAEMGVGVRSGHRGAGRSSERDRALGIGGARRIARGHDSWRRR